MRRAPAHAGRLRPWERSVFVVVFALMLAFVVVVTMSAAHSKGHQPVVAGTPAKTPALVPGTGTGTGLAGGSAATGSAVQTSTGAVAETVTRSARLDRRLSAALAGLVRRSGGRFAVGVIDASAGTEAVFGNERSFRAAGLAGTDLVAALLLAHQHSGQRVTGAESGLAAAVVQSGSQSAAAAIAARLRSGLPAANTALKLHRTHGRSWAEQMTTVGDQLQLLTDLSADNSPLHSAGRDYLLGLMSAAAAGQRWGVPAAAAARTGYAVKDGWLKTGDHWVVNSTGIVEHDGHALLIAVLSDGSLTKAAGISLVQSAAVTAARVATSSS